MERATQPFYTTPECPECRGTGIKKYRIEGSAFVDAKACPLCRPTQPPPDHPEPSRPQAEPSRDANPSHIEALHQQANRWDERALAALQSETYRGGHPEPYRLDRREKIALRRFQLAECLRRLATRLTVEQVTEGDG